MTQLQLGASAPPPAHPVVGVQKDIRYYGTSAKSVLNSPESTGMPFWSINPYVGCAFGCAYCYARFAHRFVMERGLAAGAADTPIADDQDTLPAWLAFERRVFVKRNAADVLRHTLRQPSMGQGAVQRGEPIVIGTATDPYQPAERMFRVTRSILEVLAEARRLHVVIITKSPLITRDIDLLSKIAAHSSVTVHLSLITLDRDLARRIEPRAPTPEARLRALQRLREAGIQAGINLMPVLPGLTDRPDALAALIRRVAEAGASHINASALRLRSTARQRYLPFLSEEFPELAHRYERTFERSSTMPLDYRTGLSTFVKRLCAEHGVQFGTADERMFETRDGNGGSSGDVGDLTDSSASDSQLELSIANA